MNSQKINIQGLGLSARTKTPKSCFFNRAKILTKVLKTKEPKNESNKLAHMKYYIILLLFKNQQLLVPLYKRYKLKCIMNWVCLIGKPSCQGMVARQVVGQGCQTSQLMYLMQLNCAWYVITISRKNIFITNSSFYFGALLPFRHSDYGARTP